MIIEINYSCPKCKSTELSSWDYHEEDISQYSYYCYCSECGQEFEANVNNSSITKTN